MRYVADDLPELSADNSHECSNECGKEAPFTFAESDRCTYDQAVRPVDPERVVNVSRHGSGGRRWVDELPYGRENLGSYSSSSRTPSNRTRLSCRHSAMVLDLANLLCGCSQADSAIAF